MIAMKRTATWRSLMFNGLLVVVLFNGVCLWLRAQDKFENHSKIPSRRDTVLTKRDVKYSRLEEETQPVLKYEEIFNRSARSQQEAEEYGRKILELKNTITSLQLEAEHLVIENALQGDVSCYLTEEQQKDFPECAKKIEYLKTNWRSHSCYAELGVTGHVCSIRTYLSRAEHLCPPLPGQPLQPILAHEPQNATIKETTRLRLEVDGLIDILNIKQSLKLKKNYAWITDRIKQMWPQWVNAVNALKAKQLIEEKPRKRVWIHIGMASHRRGFHMADNAYRGGSLGELVQWADVIASFYILGHDVTITSEYDQLKLELLGNTMTTEQSCTRLASLTVDVIVVDGVGWWNQIQPRFPHLQHLIKCKLWLLDSFGTEPAFNAEKYAVSHSLNTSWGMLNLQPKQFFTLFPHTPDNSFMGFVVNLPGHLPPTQGQVTTETKNVENIALVYGKSAKFWEGKRRYLEVVNKSVAVHGTASVSSKAYLKNLPEFVVNHGHLNASMVHNILHKTKLFLGLGFPYEGPAPLEAIAHGAVFINPKFSTPHGRDNTKFFRDKPTNRKLSSQNPYAEHVIGEPNVRTVDINNDTAVHEAITQALRDLNEGKVHGYLPYEFTAEGMLQRVDYYITHQDFCGKKGSSVPSQDVSYVTSQEGESCITACNKHTLVCEPSNFKDINSIDMLEMYMAKNCTSKQILDNDVIYPAMTYDTSYCGVQNDSLLFSCAGERNTFQRLCPCRTSVKHQWSICQHCL